MVCALDSLVQCSIASEFQGQYVSECPARHDNKQTEWLEMVSPPTANARGMTRYS